MTLLDLLLLSFILLAAAHGSLRGIRPALGLTVSFLGAMLAGMLFIPPLERGALSLSRIDPGDYPGAPAVAVLILSERTAAAYLTALIPLFITLFTLFVPALLRPLLDMLIRSPAQEPVLGPASRIGGGLLGTVNGALFGLIFAAALTRLPWPPAVPAFRGSLILSAVNHLAEALIPRLAGSV